MCIIVYKPRGVFVNRQILETCFHNNPDGAGYMFPCEDRLLIKKGYFTFEGFHAAWERCRKIHGDKLPVVFHFRIATAGGVDKLNCHPHRISHDLGFVHNGILSRVKASKNGKFSDTILYRNRYLDGMTGYSLRDTKLLKAIGRHIGAGNKFVFMNGKGRVVICNEKQGLWKDGLWFSNQSFLPRRVIPFSSFGTDWLCEYCGKALFSPDELAEGACVQCLNHFTPDTAQCGGCFETLPSNAHRELGWCDTCGAEVYGRDWPVNHLEYAQSQSRLVVG